MKRTVVLCLMAVWVLGATSVAVTGLHVGRVDDVLQYASWDGSSYTLGGTYNWSVKDLAAYSNGNLVTVSNAAGFQYISRWSYAGGVYTMVGYSGASLTEVEVDPYDHAITGGGSDTLLRAWNYTPGAPGSFSSAYWAGMNTKDLALDSLGGVHLLGNFTGTSGFYYHFQNTGTSFIMDGYSGTDQQTLATMGVDEVYGAGHAGGTYIVHYDFTGNTGSMATTYTMDAWHLSQAKMIEADGNILYTADGVNLERWLLDVANNTFILTASAALNPSAMVLDPTDGSLHAIAGGTIYNYSYDGTSTLALNGSSFVGAEAFEIIAIPEPMTTVLLGLGSLVALRKRG